MKIYVAHLDPYNGDQAMIHAPIREQLDIQLEAWAREQMMDAGSPHYRPEMAREEVMSAFDTHSMSSYYTECIELALGRPWQLAPDTEAYGEHASWWIIVSPDQEDELPHGPWETEAELIAEAAELGIYLVVN